MGIIVDALYEFLDFTYHPYKKIYGFVPKNVNPHSFRTTMWRLEKKGFIQREVIESEICFRLTEIGLREMESRNKKLLENKLIKLPKKEEKWDKVWRVVIFDIPEQNRRIRSVLRQTLRILKFAPLQKSVWISKENYTKELRDWIKELGLTNHILIFETKNLGIDLNNIIYDR